MSLSRFNPKDNTFQKLYETRRLAQQPVLLECPSAVLSKNGEVYVAVRTVFREIRFIPRVESDKGFPLTFTGLFSFDRDVAFADNRVNIHERDKQLTVHFAILGL